MSNYKINFKRLLLLSAFILLAVALGWILYRMLKPADTEPVVPPGTVILTPDDTGVGLPIAGIGSDGEIFYTTDPSQLPGSTDTGFTTTDPIDSRDSKIDSLTDHQVIKPVLSTDGSSIQYYNPRDQHFYRLDENGNARLLSDKKFNRVEEVTWSPQQDQAVIYYPDGTKTIYNFDEETQVTLPDHWYDFSWSNSNDQLAFKSLGYDIENSWLAVVNDDGTGSRQIEKIGINADKIITSWSPNNQVIGFLNEGLSFDQKTIYFIGLNGENFKAITTNGRGFEHQWSPQGDKLLFSTYSSVNEFKPMLWRVDAQGDSIGNNQYPLNLETWSHKCAFVSNNEAYCAVPQFIEEGAGLFPIMTNNTPDDLYHINLDTGAKILIDRSEYNMGNLIVTDDKDILYFTDGLTGRLHKIEL